MFYSKSTGGFYSHEIHGDNIPADAVKITTKEHAALLEGQSQGKLIVADENGFPVLASPPAYPIPAPDPTALRADAYREESDPLFFKAQRGEATMDEWTAKVAEIRARFPK